MKANLDQINFKVIFLTCLLEMDIMLHVCDLNCLEMNIYSSSGVLFSKKLLSPTGA